MIVTTLNAAYPVWTMNRLKSHGLGRILMHLLSIWCLYAALSVVISNPKILLSAPADNTICFCCIPATPITADEWRFLCKTFGFHEFSPPSLSVHSTTAWSLPPVTKQTWSHGIKFMLLMMPLRWGFCSKKHTRSPCQCITSKIRVDFMEQSLFSWRRNTRFGCVWWLSGQICAWSLPKKCP